MTEAALEKAFVKHAMSQSCYCLKVALISGRGFPDRTILCPGGKIFFIEFKTPWGKLSRNQILWKTRLTNLGFNCHVIDDLEAAKRLLDDTLKD